MHAHLKKNNKLVLSNGKKVVPDHVVFYRKNMATIFVLSDYMYHQLVYVMLLCVVYGRKVI